MFLALLSHWHGFVGAFNVFKYITFRTFGASITSVLIAMCAGPAYIRLLKVRQIGQHIRDDGPQSHLSKKGTPTMGGGLILGAVMLSSLLWADLGNHNILLTLAVTLVFGCIGYLDDARKVQGKQSQGLTSRQKFLAQCACGLLAGLVLYQYHDPSLRFPFFKDLSCHLGVWYVVMAAFVIVGASNGVNLTDGLDGLAVGPCTTTFATFAILTYCAGHSKIAEYLQIPYVPGCGELAVICGAFAAACLGFLWFNTYPAQVFMGDVGSLALGAALGCVAIISKNEIVLALCGGIFVMETLSVIAQVVSFKMTGKRVFRMAPIHHHFELKGWAEPKVIVRFWIISILLALVTLSTLKLR